MTVKVFRKHIERTQEMLSLFLTNLNETYFSQAVLDSENDDQDYMDYATIILTNIQNEELKQKVYVRFKKLELV